jgi:predicted aconitase with swiveling domain
MGGGVDTETGEIIEAAIPKFGKESLTIKIKKQ